MSKRNGWFLGSAALAAAGLLCMLLGTIALAAGIFANGGGGGGGGGDARPRFRGGRPVGLYFMTRFWGGTGTLEKAAWYFAPDGSVYQDLERGFSEQDLAAHDGRRGTCEVDGDNMTVTWANGKSTTSEIERDGDAFTWDMGIFSPVEPFDDEDVLVGTWEGGESLSGGKVAVSKSLRFDDDGTFNWSSVSFLTTGDLTGSAEGGTSGKWEVDGYSLILTDGSGTQYRGIAFPYDDEKTPVNPDWFFFGGTMYRRP